MSSESRGVRPLPPSCLSLISCVGTSIESSDSNQHFMLDLGTPSWLVALIFPSCFHHCADFVLVFPFSPFSSFFATHFFSPFFLSFIRLLRLLARSPPCPRRVRWITLLFLFPFSPILRCWPFHKNRLLLPSSTTPTLFLRATLPTR